MWMSKSGQVELGESGNHQRGSHGSGVLCAGTLVNLPAVGRCVRAQIPNLNTTVIYSNQTLICIYSRTDTLHTSCYYTLLYQSFIVYLPSELNILAQIFLENFIWDQCLIIHVLCSLCNEKLCNLCLSLVGRNLER